MDLETAKSQAELRLRKFVDVEELTTEVLNDIENEVNELIEEWMQEKFFVVDDQRSVVFGIKIWYDLFDDQLRIQPRYRNRNVAMQSL